MAKQLFVKLSISYHPLPFLYQSCPDSRARDRRHVTMLLTTQVIRPNYPLRPLPAHSYLPWLRVWSGKKQTY
jgi:hypothetical protein